MDLRQLNYFVAVAEERHLGRAAARLHMSQPPLSRHIQALESGLGVRLFERTPRGMQLTQAGETLLRDARNVRALLEQAEHRAQQAGAGQLGRLDVGVYGSSVFGPVAQVLAKFRASHPDVDVVLHPAQAPAQVAALRQGRVLLVFERLLPREPDLTVERVTREPLWVAVNERHPLAARDIVDVKALRGETLLVGSAPAAAATMVELCRNAGFDPQFGPPSVDLVAATLQAAIGSAVTIVPAAMTNVHIPGIAYRRLKARGPALMDLHCFWRTEERSPLLAAMLQTVRAFARETAPRRK